MKVKLYRKWIRKVQHAFSGYHKAFHYDIFQNLKLSFTWKRDKSSSSTVFLHELARRYWTFKENVLDKHPTRIPSDRVKKLVAYAQFLKSRYRKHSRKWKLASSKLSRAIENGNV